MCSSATKPQPARPTLILFIAKILPIAAALVDHAMSAAFQEADKRFRSRGAFRPSFANSFAPLRNEGAGNAGCALHPRSRVPKVAQLAHTSIQGSGNTPTSPAQWLYGLLRALPGERACLPPSLADRSTSLTPASRRQDHTTSPYAFVHPSARKSAPEQKRPPHLIPTYSDDGRRPSSG